MFVSRRVLPLFPKKSNSEFYYLSISSKNSVDQQKQQVLRLLVEFLKVWFFLWKLLLDEEA